MRTRFVSEVYFLLVSSLFALLSILSSKSSFEENWVRFLDLVTVCFDFVPCVRAVLSDSFRAWVSFYFGFFLKVFNGAKFMARTKVTRCLRFVTGQVDDLLKCTLIGTEKQTNSELSKETRKMENVY